MSSRLTFTQNEIENRIFHFRGTQVILDSDLAKICQIETRVLNQAVNRNIERFPELSRFQITEVEFENWKSQIVMSSAHGGHRTLPYAFTEQGVAMLSAVLRSDVEVKVSIQIMSAFVEMRKFIANHYGLLQRMDGIERKQLETDQKFEEVFKALESKNAIPNQGVFFDRQVFDAYELASKIIRSAKISIVLIDNYIDKNTLTHLSKKTKAIKVLLLTKTMSNQLTLDVKKANEQYGNFETRVFANSYDRFIIIDNSEVYHLRASLNDLGKKWFSFLKMDKSSVTSIIKKIDDE